MGKKHGPLLFYMAKTFILKRLNGLGNEYLGPNTSSIIPKVKSEGME